MDKPNRLLSAQDIAEMEKLTVVTEAIDAGDLEGAKKLARRMYNESLSMHDLYLNWTGATLSFIGKRFGDEALEEVLDAGVKSWWGRISKRCRSARRRCAGA
jgi:hypothetical protein